MSFLDRWLVGLVLAASLSSAAMARSPSAPDLGAEQAVIAGLRRANNEAIAARDLDATMRMAADDYVAVGGNDGLIRSKEEMRKLWAKDFASPHPANQCVRRPATIRVGQAAGVLRAAESGRWQCHGETSSGAATPYGSYFAHWSKRSGEWRLISDNYVTLGCRGPGC
jgi:ketosteroid isomerase-like protein